MTALAARHQADAARSLPPSDAILARASGENFGVAGALLGRTTQRRLLSIYGFARLVDEAGDAPADGTADRLLALVEDELDRTFAGEPRQPLFRALASTVAECALPRGPFERLIAANRLDQVRPEYETFAELLEYCDLSANPVGELVLYVFGVATPERVALSDAVCTALQLVEHWQDVGEDARRGRIYLPGEDRRRFAVGREQLQATQTSPELRRLLAFEAQRAADLLGDGAGLLPLLRGRARLAVAGYVGGGRAALDTLAACDYDVLPRTVRAGRLRRACAVASTLARAA